MTPEQLRKISDGVDDAIYRCFNPDCFATFNTKEERDKCCSKKD